MAVEISLSRSEHTNIVYETLDNIMAKVNLDIDLIAKILRVDNSAIMGVYVHYLHHGNKFLYILLVTGEIRKIPERLYNKLRHGYIIGWELARSVEIRLQSDSHLLEWGLNLDVALDKLTKKAHYTNGTLQERQEMMIELIERLSGIDLYSFLCIYWGEGCDKEMKIITGKTTKEWLRHEAWSTRVPAALAGYTPCP